MTEVEARGLVRSFIVENFLYMRPDYTFEDEDSLLKKGIFDSLGVTEVISFVEQKWEIEVPNDHVTEDNFGTVAGIARYVTQGSGSIQWSANAGQERAG